VDEEGRIDTDDGAVAAVDLVGMCVTAQPSIGLVEGDSVTTGQHERSSQTGYTAADNGDRSTFFLRHVRYSEQGLEWMPVTDVTFAGRPRRPLLRMTGCTTPKRGGDRRL
jgi:hypothetical protein